MRDHIDHGVCHLDVDSTYPPEVEGWKGSAVRRLKGYVSWVKNVVKQFGSYLLYKVKLKKSLFFVRKDRNILTSGSTVVINKCIYI